MRHAYFDHPFGPRIYIYYDHMWKIAPHSLAEYAKSGMSEIEPLKKDINEWISVKVRGNWMPFQIHSSDKFEV